MAVSGLTLTTPATTSLRELLAHARSFKSTSDIGEPLPVSEFSQAPWIRPIDQEPDKERDRRTNTILETAARSLLYELVANTPVDDDEFVDIWNLLDIIQIFGDHGLCDPALVFWLVEELLAIQSIDGCRRVFDWLESRRERLVAKDFSQTKNLIVLRMFNELLRRLSRAEDAVFCGRVFIFLFQSFPLGDKSSVNLRGEFHTENVTTFERDADALTSNNGEHMDVDKNTNGDVPLSTSAGDGEPEAVVSDVDNPEAQTENEREAMPAATSDASKKLSIEDETSQLYSIFWTLQQYFSNPLRLFSDEEFEKLKNGLESTISMFKRVPKVVQAKSDNTNRTNPTRNGESQVKFASDFNPKYLTSRDLFKLEVSDLAFQRHILVQAMIITDFLLSLTEKSKKRLHKANIQKGLQYSYVLDDKKADWANAMRNTITAYLKEGPEGMFYCRMVDTVLTRDKNWVRWKMDGCPPIAREPVDAPDWTSAEKGLTGTFSSRKLRSMPMGALELGFLDNDEDGKQLESLENPERHTIPDIDSLLKSIANDELDMDFVTTDEEKKNLEESMNGKSWRTLRAACGQALYRLQDTEDGKKLHVLSQHYKPDLEQSTITEDTTKEDAAKENAAKENATMNDTESTDANVPDPEVS